MNMFSKKIFLCVMGLIVGWLISCAYAEQDLTAEKLLERCAKEGSIALVNRLTLGDEWKQVADKIATADDDWIEVARCLFHGVYFGEDEWAFDPFMPAMAEALRKKPTVILGFEHSGISLLNVCSLPFDEDLAVLENYMQEVLPRLDELAVIGKRVNSDSAEICSMRMRNAYERRKERIREREERERRQNSRNNSNQP